MVKKSGRVYKMGRVSVDVWGVVSRQTVERPCCVFKRRQGKYGAKPDSVKRGLGKSRA